MYTIYMSQKTKFSFFFLINKYNDVLLIKCEMGTFYFSHKT